MEPYAKRMGFGLWLVPCAYEHYAALNALERFLHYFDVMAGEYGTRATAVHGIKRRYRILHATAGGCKCKPLREGFGKLKAFEVEEIPPLQDVDDGLRREAALAQHERPNQTGTNLYAFKQEEGIPWHSDEDCLVAAHCDVVSLSLGGVVGFCVAPSWSTQTEWNKVGPTYWRRKYTQFKEDLNAEGLRFCIPLHHGDVLVMSGSFQRFLQHKTVPIVKGDFAEEMRLRTTYTGKSPGVDFLWRALKKEQIGRDRCCITWRWVENHCKWCPRCTMSPPEAVVEPPLCGETRPGAGTSAPTSDGQPPPPLEAYGGSSVSYI
jgi:hypothetical protein